MKYPIEDPVTSRNRVSQLLNGAFTRTEIEEARVAYADHLRQFPEDRALDLAHGFSHAVEYLEQRQAESNRLGLTENEHVEREQLLRRVSESTQSLDPAQDRHVPNKYNLAKGRLRRWLSMHPGDKEVVSLVERLDEESKLAQMIHDVMFENAEALDDQRSLQLV